MAKNKFITNNSNGKHNITNRPHFKIRTITYSNKQLEVTIIGKIDFSKLIDDNTVPTEWSSLAIVATDANEPAHFDVIFKKKNNTISCWDQEGNKIIREENGNTIFTFSSNKDIDMTNDTLSTNLQNILFFTGIAQILGNVYENVNGRNFASGYGNVTGISDNVIIGRENESFGRFGAIFGYKNIGSQAALIAGSNNIITTLGAGAIGSSNKISNSGDTSFACGQSNTITGKCALISGTGNSITSQGAYSFVCGQENKSYSKSSFICGYSNKIASSTTKGCNFIGGTGSTIASNVDYCIVYGQGLQAKQTGQTIFGKYNKDHADALFIIGNGTSGTRKNALVLNKDEELEVKSIILSSISGNKKYKVTVDDATGTLITNEIPPESM